jgi:N-terminal TM domain of oligopeptide transport permease C
MVDVASPSLIDLERQARPAARRSLFFRRLRSNHLAIVGAIIVLLLIVTALAAPRR